MATAVQNIGDGMRSGPAGAPPSNARSRIVAAAAEVLRTEPENFSVQRVARQASISARAVYGHFESGAELARTARLSVLEKIVAKLPADISDLSDGDAALRRFALEIARTLRPQGAAWLLLSRQDEVFRAQYRRSFRLPLIRVVNNYLRQRQSEGRLAHDNVSNLAELLVTTIESIVINDDPDLALELDSEEAVDRVVRAICKAYSI